MKWMVAGVLVVIAIGVILTSGSLAETINWINPTTYTDNTIIPAAKASQLLTDLEYKIGAGTWTAYGTAVGGASTFSGPYVTSPGGSSTWRARSVSIADNNSTSAWSPEVTFTRPFQVPAGPAGVGVR